MKEKVVGNACYESRENTYELTRKEVKCGVYMETFTRMCSIKLRFILVAGMRSALISFHQFQSSPENYQLVSCLKNYKKKITGVATEIRVPTENTVYINKK